MITLQHGFADLTVVLFRSSDLVNLPILVANIQAAVIGFIGIGLTFIFLKYDDKSFSHIGVKRRSNITFLVLVALGATVFALFVANIIESLGNVVSFDQMMRDRFKIESDLSALIEFGFRFIVVLGGIAIGEEIMFRGYIQNLLESQISFKYATIISSVLFGLIHSFLLTSATKQAIQSMVAVGISATIFGFVFAYAYHITGKNIILPVLIHGIWNNIIFYFNTEYNYETIWNILAEILSQLVAALIILYILYRLQDKLN